MSQAPRLAIVLRRPDLVLAAASWGPVCARPAAAVLAGLTTAPSGLIHPWPPRKNSFTPCFPPRSPGDNMLPGPRTAIENP